MVRLRDSFLAALALGALVSAAEAAELPSSAKKTAKPPETAQGVRKCNVGGMPGVLAASGVCVRLSGYVSTQVGAGLPR